MTLSEELAWRGFVNQTTFKDIAAALDGEPLTFYLGMDPSAQSLTVGNLAVAMMIRHFIDHGHKAIMLVGGATGLIGDPDGKAEERELKTPEEVARNKAAIAGQYDRILNGQSFEHVDNYDWFKDIGYLEFLREVGRHVPMSQMLGREFVQSRLGEDGSGITYAEFSYALIQGYDFLHLYRTKGVTLQLCGADQWGNCIAGVELIRRIEGGEAHVWSAPLVVNKATGRKFGKSEDGAVWLDPAQTTPTQYYQFWVNCDDEGIEDYLKVYTLLDKPTLDGLMTEHRADPGQRLAQKRLAAEATRLIHGEEALRVAEQVTACLTGRLPVGEVDARTLEALRREIPSVLTHATGSIIDTLVEAGLAGSKGEARRLLTNGGIAVNDLKTDQLHFTPEQFTADRLLIRRGKAYKDSALVELA